MDWCHWKYTFCCLMIQVYTSLHITSATQCNQNLTAAESKTLLTSPGYPIKYEPSQTCWWLIRAPLSSKNVILETVDSLIEHSSSCSNDYLNIYNGDSSSAPRLNTLCGDSRVFLASTGQNLYLEFRSNGNLETRGFQFRYYQGSRTTPCSTTYSATRDKKVLTSPGYPVSYYPSLSCEYTIQAWNSSYRLQFDFTDIDIQSSQTCSYDKVTIEDIAAGGAVQTLSTVCGRQTASFQSGGYRMKVTFTTDAAKNNHGFSANYRSVPKEDCTLILLATDMDSYILSPGYPTSYYSNLHCKWNIVAADHDAVIELETVDSNIADNTPSCSSDRVTVTNSDKTELGTFCGTSKPRYQSTGPNMTVAFTTDRTSQSTGFRLRYKQILSGNIPACGTQSLTANATKHVSSPGYPKEDFRRQTCRWTITALNQRFVRIYLLDLDVEFNGADSLKIYDGASTSNILATLTGRVNGYCLQSTGRVMTVVYQTDDSNNGRGFNISYSQTSDDNDDSCSSYGLTASSTYSYIFSPRYPLSYPGNSEKPTYTLTSNYHYRIKLEVLSSDLPAEVSGQCSRDYVSVYDGYQATSMPLKSINTQKCRFCGTERPTFVSTNNVMLVVFHTQGTPTNTGFQMRYKSGAFTDEYVSQCGGSLTATDSAQSVTSPNYPNSYDGKIRCTWTITASDRSKYVRLTGTEFQFDSTVVGECQYQSSNLKISDGSSDAPNTVWECGNVTLLRRQSTSYVMTLLLRAEGTYRGMNLQYLQTRDPLPCDYTININDNARSGNIIFPGDVEGYSRSRSCSWLLRRADSTKTLDITVTKSDITTSESCTGDKLMIYDGSSRSSPLIGRFCGIGLPSFRMTGRNVFITFVATSQPVSRTFTLSYLAADRTFWNRVNKYAQRRESTLLTPNYPLHYQRNAEYSWDLYTVTIGENVIIKVVTSDIEESDGCVNDRVQVHDGASKSSKLLGQWCGKDTPTFRSSRQHMGLYLISNENDVTGAGFKINFYSLKEDNDSNVGAIVGGVIGALLAVCLIGAIVFIVVKKPFRRRRRGKPATTYAVK
ncbi:cubilin-like [Haliotis asinina]|uniref:cubilin-like n=1 Tax=Haliotis asinina TaxID=109174 RepID=UPI003532263B